MQLFCIVTVCKKQVKRFRGYEAQTRRFQDASYKECKKGGKNKETDYPQKECHCETEIQCIGDGCSKILHCKDQKNQGGTKDVLWAGHSQKISLGCSNRSKGKYFDEQEGRKWLWDNQAGVFSVPKKFQIRVGVIICFWQ